VPVTACDQPLYRSKVEKPQPFRLIERPPELPHP
jgi:hypothetical protein